MYLEKFLELKLCIFYLSLILLIEEAIYGLVVNVCVGKIINMKLLIDGYDRCVDAPLFSTEGKY